MSFAPPLRQSATQSPTRIVSADQIDMKVLQRENHGARSVASESLAVTQESGWTAADFTTTNTADWQQIAGTSIQIPLGRMCFFAWSELVVSHSAAAAEVSVYMGLFGTDSVGYSIMRKNNIYLATATKRVSITISCGFNVPDQAPLLLRGTCSLYLYAFNHTAGTLTLADDAGTQFGGRFMHALVAGDAS